MQLIIGRAITTSFLLWFVYKETGWAVTLSLGLIAIALEFKVNGEL